MIIRAQTFPALFKLAHDMGLHKKKGQFRPRAKGRGYLSIEYKNVY